MIWDFDSLINGDDTSHRTRVAFKFFFLSALEITVEREHELSSGEGNKLSFEFIEGILEFDKRGEETSDVRLPGI